jgi:hypothetical protein
MQVVRTAAALAVFFAADAFLSAPLAHATPRPLPFTYNYETLGEGELEVEQYVDLDPIRVYGSTSATPIWALASQFQTEFEYGITNRLELGLYVTLAPEPTGGQYSTSSGLPSLMESNGVKQRLRYRLLDEGVLPIDIGLYGELTENDHEFEIEAKVILQKRFGNLRIAANVVGEHEWYFASPQQDWIFDPSAGVTYQVTPVFQPGIDSWMWFEHTNQPAALTETMIKDTTMNLRPNVYVGPAMLFNFGKFWWSTGVYFRVTNLSYNDAKEGTVGNDIFGPLWFRTIMGISF